MMIAPSLFDTPAGSPLPVVSNWITGTLLGSLAISLCVIAVVFVGLMLMSGRLAIRDAVRVVIGCFVLLGAPLVSAGLRNVADEAIATVPQSPASVISPRESVPSTPSTYDPYAGASLRTE